jgi:ankyrin repeat protein
MREEEASDFSEESIPEISTQEESISEELMSEKSITEKGKQKKKGFLKRVGQKIKQPFVASQNQKIIEGIKNLSEEEQQNYLLHLTHNPPDQKVKKTLQLFSLLFRENDYLKAIISQNIDVIIKNLSDSLDAPTIVVASLLNIPPALRYLQSQLAKIAQMENKDFLSNPELIALLVNPDVNINVAIDNNGNTLLMSAIEQANLEKFNLLIKNKKLKINTTNKEKNNALHTALSTLFNTKDKEKIYHLTVIIQKLLDKKINSKYRNNNGKSSLDLLIEIEVAYPELEEFTKTCRGIIFANEQGIK